MSLNFGNIGDFNTKIVLFFYKNILFLFCALLYLCCTLKSFFILQSVKIVCVYFVAVSCHKLFRKQVIHISNLCSQKKRIKMKLAANTSSTESV